VDPAALEGSVPGKGEYAVWHIDGIPFTRRGLPAAEAGSRAFRNMASDLAAALRFRRELGLASGDIEEVSTAKEGSVLIMKIRLPDGRKALFSGNFSEESKQGLSLPGISHLPPFGWAYREI